MMIFGRSGAEFLTLFSSDGFGEAAALAIFRIGRSARAPACRSQSNPSRVPVAQVATRLNAQSPCE